MIAIANSGGDNLLSPVAIQVGQVEVVQVPGVPILREQLAIGIENGQLIGPPWVMDVRNHDSRRLLRGCLQNYQRHRSVCGWRSLELGQLSARGPTPFFFAAIRITDKGRR